METTENTMINQNNSFDFNNSKENLLKSDSNKKHSDSDSVSINKSNKEKIEPEEQKLKANSIINPSDSITQINLDSHNNPDNIQTNTEEDINKSNLIVNHSISIDHSDDSNNNDKKEPNKNEVDTQNKSEKENKPSSIISHPDSISIVISNATENNDEHKKELLSVISHSDSVSIDISTITQINGRSSSVVDSSTVHALNDTEGDPKVGVKKSKNSINKPSDNVSVDKSKDTPSKSEKQKKKRSFIGFCFRLLIWTLSFVLSMGIFYAYICIVLEMNETRDFDDLNNRYSNKTDIDDHYMNFRIDGNENEKTIVLLPGLGCASPIIEYKPLAELLSDKFKVVTLEPFGYGFSEDIENKRTMKVIVSDLQKCLKKLEINKYYLMGHSLGGLYSLEWARDYTNEVLGFIGLDGSFPGVETIKTEKEFLEEKKKEKYINYMGINRIKYFLKPELLPIDHSYKYTSEELEIEKLSISKNIFTRAMLNDINDYYSNLSKLSGVKFPNEVPVLNFVSNDSIKTYKKWNDIQHNVLGNNTRNEVVILDGPHKIYFEQKDAIVKKVNEWIN